MPRGLPPPLPAAATPHPLLFLRLHLPLHYGADLVETPEDAAARTFRAAAAHPRAQTRLLPWRRTRRRHRRRRSRRTQRCATHEDGVLPRIRRARRAPRRTPRCVRYAVHARVGNVDDRRSAKWATFGTRAQPRQQTVAVERVTAGAQRRVRLGPVGEANGARAARRRGSDTRVF